jgi:hypothetical protein
MVAMISVGDVGAILYRPHNFREMDSDHNYVAEVGTKPDLRYYGPTFESVSLQGTDGACMSSVPIFNPKAVNTLKFV